MSPSRVKKKSLAAAHHKPLNECDVDASAIPLTDQQGESVVHGSVTRMPLMIRLNSDDLCVTLLGEVGKKCPRPGQTLTSVSRQRSRSGLLAGSPLLALRSREG
jgi:hypothetical protein